MKTLKKIFEETARPELIELSFKRKYRESINDISAYCWKNKKLEAIRTHAFLSGFVTAHCDVGFFSIEEHNNMIKQLNYIVIELLDTDNIDDVRKKSIDLKSII